MINYKVFNYDKPYKSTELEMEIYKMIGLSKDVEENYVKKLPHYTRTEVRGDSLTTSHLNLVELPYDGNWILKLPSFSELANWIRDKIYEYASNKLNNVRDNYTLVCERSWVNIMNKGSSVGVHCHTSNQRNETSDMKSMCVVFYYEVPELNSGNIVLLNTPATPEKMKLPIHLFTDKTIINNINGQLLVHDNMIMHGVTTHENDKPRICIVFDMTLVKNTIAPGLVWNPEHKHKKVYVFDQITS